MQSRTVSEKGPPLSASAKFRLFLVPEPTGSQEHVGVSRRQDRPTGSQVRVPPEAQETLFPRSPWVAVREEFGLL